MLLLIIFWGILWWVGDEWCWILHPNVLKPTILLFPSWQNLLLGGIDT